MSSQTDATNPLDPFGVWRETTDAGMQALREARDANMETWSRLMIDFVNSEAYSRASNEWLDTYLTVSQPFQQALEKAMTQALTSLNMPTRSDVTTLAQRMTNIEIRLDDLDVRLDEIQRALKPPAAARHTTSAAATKAKEAR